MEYKQKELVKMIANEAGYYQGAVKDILDATAVVVERLLFDASKDDPVRIKLFGGLFLGTKYHKAKENVMNPKTGEKINVEGHIYPYAKYSQAFSLKVRRACKEREKG